MAARHATRRTSLEVRSLYHLAALARDANVDIDMLRRVLRANGLVFVRQGRSLLVSLSEIRRKIPALWASLEDAETMRIAARMRAKRDLEAENPAVRRAPGAPGANGA